MCRSCWTSNPSITSMPPAACSWGWMGPRFQGVPQGCIGRGGDTPPPPLQGAQPLSPWRQVPAPMAFVTDSNRPQPLWQPPPTACLTSSEAPSLLMHPWVAPPPPPPSRADCARQKWCAEGGHPSRPSRQPKPRSDPQRVGVCSGERPRATPPPPPSIGMQGPRAVCLWWTLQHRSQTPNSIAPRWPGVMQPICPQVGPQDGQGLCGPFDFLPLALGPRRQGSHAHWSRQSKANEGPSSTCRQHLQWGGGA